MTVLRNPQIKYIAIHHTAVSREKQGTQLYAVNRYHKEKYGSYLAQKYGNEGKSRLGWWVGYNFFIDVSGETVQTREVGEETVAQVGHNCHIDSTCDTVSVCLAGDFNTELPNDKQVVALRKKLKELQVLYPAADITYHRELQTNRTCPGKLLTEDYVEKRVLQIGNDKPDHKDQEKEKEIQRLNKANDELREQIRVLINFIASLLGGKPI